jgi:hypothetical protein
MDYLFYQVAAINGYDSFGHYLRAGLILNACSQYAITPLPGCLSKFSSSSGASARAASATSVPGYADTRRSDSLRELDAFFHGKKLDLPSDGTAAAQPQQSAPVKEQQQPAPTARTDAQQSDPAQSLLDYLLGGDG